MMTADFLVLGHLVSLFYTTFSTISFCCKVYKIQEQEMKVILLEERDRRRKTIVRNSIEQIKKVECLFESAKLCE